MRTIALCATIALCLLLSHESTALAQKPENINADPTIREYWAKLPLLIERYSTNRKIRFRLTRFVVNASEGKRIGDVETSALEELIADGNQMRAVTLESKPERFKEFIQFWRPDMRFDVTRQGDKFKVVEQHLASTNYYHHELAKYNFFTHEPLRAGDFSGSTLWFDDRGRNYAIVSVVEVRPATWKGQPCVEVRSQWDNRHGMIQLASTFLDPANDYITIASETDWKLDSEKKEYKAFREVEYQPSPEGFPVPKRSHGYITYRDGSTRKVFNAEFLSYEKYVPSPEEFQLEKPYGLVTPAVVPTAENTALVPPPKPRRLWPWIAMGAGVVLAIVAVYVFRRQRRAEAPAAPPAS